MAVRVRLAVRSDADQIADAHIASWRAAYGHIFPAAIFDHPDFDTSRRVMWQAWTHSPTDDRRLAVAEVGGRVIGFAHSGHDDDPDVEHERCGEVLGFYVHPDGWGTGAAQALMDDALAHLVGLGHVAAVLWTLRDAHRARRFYEQAGWVASGRVGTWARYPESPVSEVEYARPLV